MAISQVIKYEGDNSTFIWKHPEEDFNNMTELIVNESQEAIFIANGQAADTFSRAGRYPLDAKNIPILTNLLNKVTGTSVFHCQVYFINKTVQMAMKWGVDSKIRFNEPLHNVPVEAGIFGEMNLAVSDGRKLLIKLVGTMGGVSWDGGESQFAKSLKQLFQPAIGAVVKSSLPTAITRRNIDVIRIDEQLMNLSADLREKLLPEFEEYGLTIPQFYIGNIALTETEHVRNLRALHTYGIQTEMSRADAQLRSAQAKDKASYMTAEAEAEASIKAAKRNVIMEEQTTQTEIAKVEAQRRLIQAETEARAAQMAGMAEAAVMQAKGYSQKDVLQTEVQKAYAEGLGNMGPVLSSGGSSVMGEMLGAGVGMMAASAMAPQLGEMMKGFQFGNAQMQTPEPIAAASTIQCPKCGKQLPADAKFCASCGTEIVQLAENEMICPACKERVPKGAFCIKCGKSMVNQCPKCGKELPQGAKFCSDCGTKL